ncbi:hypothetical protein [Thermocrinis jamiesonii]|uniref:hypothetical protein n=1 Tax=Thermocrinis jamiesonii TaxID=1302351 RepID=UPI000495F7FF|nr:hypothetical protein [Thermocrinis jamiesonii]
MIKWILYLLVAFLIIDHLWIHYGGPFIEKLRGEYREELKKAVSDEQAIEVQKAYKQSILDKIWESIRSLAKKDQGGEKDE